MDSVVPPEMTVVVSAVDSAVDSIVDSVANAMLTVVLPSKTFVQKTNN